MASCNESPQDFGVKVDKIFSNSMTSLAVITGLETGLFQVLIGFEEYKSFEDIAQAAKLKPRYVKELLGALTVSGIVDIDPTTEKYFLPEHRRNYFNREKLESVSAQFLELLPELYLMRGKVAKCFQPNGPQGVAPNDYLSYSKDVSKITALEFQRTLVSFLEKVDGLVDLVESGVEVLDLACGVGDSTLIMAQRFPKSNFLGVDFLAEQLEIGKKRAEERNVANVNFKPMNIEQLPREWNEKFDFVFCHNAVHDLAHPDQGLREFYRVLKPSGIGLIIDINLHSKQSQNMCSDNAIQKYVFSLIYCMPGSLYFEGGHGLGAAWGVERAVELIEAAGFDVTTQVNEETLTKVSYICTKQISNKT